MLDGFVDSGYVIILRVQGAGCGRVRVRVDGGLVDYGGYGVGRGGARGRSVRPSLCLKMVGNASRSQALLIYFSTKDRLFCKFSLVSTNN